MALTGALLRLQDTAAQIRVRGAFVVLITFAASRSGLGLEVILGAFMAGAILTLVDRDQAMTHPDVRRTLEAAGYGIVVPVFFVTSGIRFDLDALFASGESASRVPIFLVALLLVSGVPAVVYRPLLGRRDTLVAGVLRATSLPFVVAASMIGIGLGALDEATGAAFIAAGLLSVLLFPPAAPTILRRSETANRARSGRPVDAGA